MTVGGPRKSRKQLKEQHHQSHNKSKNFDKIIENYLPKHGLLNWLGCRSASSSRVSSLKSSSQVDPIVHAHAQLRVNREFRTRIRHNQSHRLPLPPTSNLRSSSVCTNTRISTTQVTKWKKGTLIGTDSSSNVYFGFDGKTGEICAIKEVMIASNDDHASKESLNQLKEIHFLRQLSHPNILQYYGSKSVDNTLFIYLEYVSGCSILELLQQYGPLGEPAIQKYLRQIVSGIVYIHERNIVHRNIKGASIFVDSNGEVKLANFGMAKHVTNSPSTLPFKKSNLHWTAPELLMDTNTHTLAMDIWSLGCTILEMATSKPPWSQHKEEAATFIIGNGKEIPEIPSHLSNNAKSFARLCLQTDPSLRPTASQLQDHPFIRCKTASRITHTMSFDNRSKMQSTVELTTSGSLRSCPPRENLSRTTTSLPLSPFLSPLQSHNVDHQEQDQFEFVS